jgi:MoaA/NifB/PqqE/SkfB family radical SAM enzyme
MNNTLTSAQIEVYNQKRKQFDTSRNINVVSPCIAPLNNMYFTTEGQVAPCWLQVGYVDQWGPGRSIKDIWNGEVFNKIRHDLKNGIFNNKCGVCKSKIDADTWPLALAYDGFPVGDYPTCMELELSNQCNLECIMCEGRLSSGIRKNRDKLPPIPQIYDDSFIEQFVEFIPHLHELRFNGGEPFAQKIVFDICKIVAKINPGLRVNIATNGTVYNKQVREILDTCTVHLNISIDSLDKTNYESIRLNGDFDMLMKNFHIFKEYCRINNRNLSIMVNPMRNNWHEMPEFVKFTNNHRVHLWYNTIHHPEHLSLWNLKSTKLFEIFNTLSPFVEQLKPSHITDDHIKYGNWQKLDHFVNHQINNWLKKQLEKEQSGTGKKTIQINLL